MREHWASRFGFLMAALGSAIGIGTLWKFPYVAGAHGGGVFILAYLVSLVLFGVPIYAAELVLGRSAQKGVVGTFTSLAPVGSAWRGVGWLSLAGPVLMLSYYTVVSGWALNYLGMSLVHFQAGKSDAQISGIFDILYRAGGMNVLSHGAAMALTAAFIYSGVRRGIEYWSKFLTSGLLVIFVGLVLYNISLDGFGQAVDFIFTPDLARFEGSALLEAVGLALFTLSVGHGVLVTYGSYMKRTDDIPKTALLVAGMMIVIATCAALLVFPPIFSFGMDPEGGIGLIFRVLPVLFHKLPGGMVMGVAFFVLLVFTALTSAVAILEVPVANFMDVYGWSRRKTVGICAVAIFVLGLPSALSGSGALFSNWEAIYGRTFFETLDHLVSVWILPLTGLFTSLFTGWRLDKKKCREEFAAGSTLGWLFPVWLFALRWVVPLALLFLILQNGKLFDLSSWFSVE